MLQTKQSQTILKLFRYSAIPLFLVAFSCAGLTSKSRTSSQENNESAAANSSVQNQGGNFTPSKNDESAPPEVVSGAYLTAFCVTDAERSCTKVRFVAKVKTSSGELVRLAIDSIRPLGIKNFSWEIPLSANYTCQSTNGGFAFNPLCSGSKSLATTVIKATLTLTANDGSIAKGESPNIPPANDDSIYGNFMLLDSSSSLIKATYAGATAAFTQIWQDLVSGYYLTNILYDGSGSTSWEGSDYICRNNVDSGDGAGKWQLPSKGQLLKFYSQQIKDVTFNGGGWTTAMRSSSPSADNPGNVWAVLLTFGNSSTPLRSDTSLGSFCARPPDTGLVNGNSNFMLLDARHGFTPSGKTGNGLDAPISGLQLFTQIWKDTTSGLYLTNILYDGSGSTNWNGSKDLCGGVDSGDGAGKWHLPSGQELCGQGFDDNEDSNRCPGGLYGHGLTTVPVVTGGKSWFDSNGNGINNVWSSSFPGGPGAWSVPLDNAYPNGYPVVSGKTINGFGVFCTRE